MHYNPTQLIPGKFGYRCRHCANVAFALEGDVRPAPGTYLEDCPAAQRGMYASERRSKHICQHCGSPVTASNGMLDMECIVDIDEYAHALQLRINSAHSRHGSSRGVKTVVVDRDYMGCGLTAAELAADIPVEAEEKKVGGEPPVKTEEKKADDEKPTDLSTALGKA